MDLLSNIKIYSDIEFKLKTGVSYYYCVDEYTAGYINRTAIKSNESQFLVFMIGNLRRCVAIRLEAIASFHVYPAVDKDEPDYTDNFNVIPALGTETTIPSYCFLDVEIPDCLIYRDAAIGDRELLSYSHLEADSLAGLDYEFSGHSDLRRFIEFEGALNWSSDHLETSSIIVFECDSNAIGVDIPAL